MPFNEPLPAENTDPWYTPLVVNFIGGLRTFVNALETTVTNLATTVAGKADASALTAGLAAKIDTTQKGAANGVATLGADGKLLPAQIPAISVLEYLGPSVNQAAMLALAGQNGDFTIRTDLSTTWVITGPNPTQLSSWTQLANPTSPVSSVQGKVGVVTLAPIDIGAASATDLNNVDTKANEAVADAAAAQATANAAIPQSSIISAIGVKGVFEGYVLNANDVTPVGVGDYDVIIRRTA